MTMEEQFSKQGREGYHANMRGTDYQYAKVEERVTDEACGAYTVLDDGCGEGIWLSQMAEKYPNIKLEGVDFSEGMVETAIVNTNKYINVRIQKGNVLQLPFADGSFDFISSFDVFEHIQIDQRDKFCSEVARVLKPGGEFALVTPNPFSWNTAPFFHPKSFMKVFFSKEGSESIWSKWEFPWSIKQRLRNAGLGVEKFETAPLLEPQVREKRIEGLLKMVSGRQFGVKQIIFARKKAWWINARMPGCAGDFNGVNE